MDTPSIPVPSRLTSEEDIAAHQACRERAERMLEEATTPLERHRAWFWIDNADRNIAKARAALDRSQR